MLDGKSSPCVIAQSDTTALCNFDKKPIACTKTTRLITICLLISTLVLIVISGVLLFFCVTNSTADIPPEVTQKRIIVHQYNRLEWGGVQPKTTKILHKPIKWVVIGHTVTKFCTQFETCSKIVASIQKYHMGLSKPDIGYNFLIGGDGNVYVGRGWEFASLSNSSIFIGVIGNFVRDEMTDEMIGALESLILYGIDNEILDDNYKIIAHNQTIATLSPGQNVYKVIQNFAHFIPTRVNLE